jgi:hypothetical protein
MKSQFYILVCACPDLRFCSASVLVLFYRESGLMVPALRIFHLLPSGHGLSTVVDLVSHGGISLLSFSWPVPIFCVKLCGSSLVLFAARCNSICSFGF